MAQIITDIMLGDLIYKEIIKKEHGGKICVNCKFRYTNPHSQYRKVIMCEACLEERSNIEISKILDDLIG